MSNRNFTLKKNFAIFVVCILLLSTVLAFAGCDLFKKPEPKLDHISAVYNGEDLMIGQELDKKDIRVTVYYTNDTSYFVGNFAVGAFDSSTEGIKTVTISYTDGDVTKTTTINVTVFKLAAIRLEAVYTGGELEVDEQPDASKLIVTVYYNNGVSKAVTNFSYGSVDTSTSGKKNWEISYTEDGVTVSVNVVITVKGYVADMYIHFMELGNNSNGDSIYIKAGDTDILIDAGSSTGSAATIEKYVDQYCTDGKLEYVIATHGDTDHIAAFVGTTKIPGIFDYYECETIIDFARSGKSTNILSDYYSKRDAEVEAGANHYTALECAKEQNGAKKVYDLAEGITMEILYQKYYETNTSNENDYSVCIMFTQGENHYLFLGDLEEAGEKSLVENNPDLPEVELYKAGHHGSPTSANEVLLSVIKPQIVCVSCVAGHTEYTQNLENTFPSQAFINRIAPYTDRVYVTTEGKIKYNESTGRWNSDGYLSMNGNIIFSCVDGVIEVHGTNNDTILKDTEWFKNNRDCPLAWQ